MSSDCYKRPERIYSQRYGVYTLERLSILQVASYIDTRFAFVKEAIRVKLVSEYPL